MSVAELLNILRNQVLVHSELEDRSVSIKEIIYNNRPELEIQYDTDTGPKSFSVQFKEIFPKAI